jgi:hypothetical protein
MPLLLDREWRHALSRFKFGTMPYERLEESFKSAFYLFSLPPTPEHGQPARRVARAHQRINAGHVKLIQLVGREHLDFIMQAGTSKTKEHSVFFPLGAVAPDYLPRPECNCVESDIGADNDWCVHMEMACQVLTRIYVVISPFRRKLFNDPSFLDLEHKFAVCDAVQLLDHRIRSYFGDALTETKGFFLHHLPSLNSFEVEPFPIHIAPSAFGSAFGAPHVIPVQTVSFLQQLEHLKKKAAMKTAKTVVKRLYNLQIRSTWGRAVKKTKIFDL